MGGKHKQFVTALDGQHIKDARARLVVGGWESDPAARHFIWSDDQYRLLGLSPDAVSPSLEAWKQCVHPKDRNRLDTELSRDCKTETICFEYRVCLPDGKVRWLVSRGKRLEDSSGRAVGMVGITVDITEAREAQERLAEFNQLLARYSRQAEQHAAQLRELNTQLTQAENRERRRLALLLHDHLQQLLIASRMKVGLITKKISKGPLIPMLTRTAEMLQEAIIACRSLSVELSPPMLYESGLSAALTWLAEQMEDKHGLQVDLQVTDEPQDQDIRAFLFQCVRELLFNVVKHAGVSNAAVSMHRLGTGRIAVTVSDRGNGFDLPTLRTKWASGDTFGLRSIDQRLHLLGGSFEITSAVNRGTQATLIVPLGGPADGAAEPAVSHDSKTTQVPPRLTWNSEEIA